MKYKISSNTSNTSKIRCLVYFFWPSVELLIPTKEHPFCVFMNVWQLQKTSWIFGMCWLLSVVIMCQRENMSHFLLYVIPAIYRSGNNSVQTRWVVKFRLCIWFLGAQLKCWLYFNISVMFSGESVKLSFHFCLNAVDWISPAMQFIE